MIRALLNRFSPPTPGGSMDAALSFEGIGGGWAFLLLAVLGAAVWWGYRRGAAGLSPGKRRVLVALRIVLVTLFVLLLVRPVLTITLNDPVRGRLLVLLDDSESMTIKDQRAANDDLARALIAADVLPPTASVTEPVPAAEVDRWKNASRATILQAITANRRLNLWPRVQERAD